MTTLYDINTRRNESVDNEPTDMENDLEERLYSARNMIDLALLAFDNDSQDLIPTAIEEAYYKLQRLVDDYCIWEV